MRFKSDSTAAPETISTSQEENMAREKVTSTKFLHVALTIALVVLVPSLGRAQSETVKLGDLAAISNAAVFIAVAQQAPFRIVADKGQAREGYGFSLLAVRKDLVDSGQVKTFRDLKGKKIAILAKGNIQHYLVGKMAEEVGLTINDVELTFLDAPSQVTAFETKAIDAAYAVEPWAARFAERGVAVRFRTPDQVKGLGPVQVGVIIYSGKFIKERRPVAQRWMNAYLKAAELFHKNGTKDPEIAAILEKYTKVPAKVIQTAIPPYQDPSGKVLVDNLADQAQWFANNGMQQKISIQNALDLGFLK